MPPILLLGLLSFEVNGVNDRIGSLGTLKRLIQALLAASIIPVGENDERLSSLLLFHQLIGRKKGRIVKYRPACMGTSRAAATIRIVVSRAVVRRRKSSEKGYLSA